MRESLVITGVRGFVGSHLARYLSKKYEIIGIDRHRGKSLLDFYNLDITFIEGDILDLEFLKRVISDYDVKKFIHLAAIATVGKAKRNPLEAIKVNILGTANVLEACRYCGIDILVYQSSDKVFSYQPRELPYKEETPLKPSDLYSSTKVCADILSQTYSKIYNLPVTIVRPCNLYGLDLNISRLIPYAIIRCLENKPIELRSDGKHVREFLYIEDYCSAIDLLLEKGNGIYNLGSGKYFQVLEVVEKIKKLTNSDSEIKILNIAKDEIPTQYLDSTKIRKLGWRPIYNFDNGILKTIEEYKRWLKSKG